MKNKSVVFKSRLFCNIYIFLGGTEKLTQGPYKVADLIRRFSKLRYSKKEFQKEIVNVAYNFARYGFHVDEYFVYDVKSMSHAGKLKFITEETRWGYYSKLNQDENLEIFDEKEKTYQLYRKFYKREIIKITSLEQIDEYNRFLQENDKIISKPLDSSGGKGVRLLTKQDTIESLLAEYKKGFIMEPVLKNNAEFAEFHANSLNTIRVATVRMDNRVEIPFAFARFGKNGACIDNARAGGIIGNIDVSSGIIYAAIDEGNIKYLVHPNSQKRIIGFQIPFWEEAKKMVTELAYVLPSNRYTGWDIVLTDSNEWVLVEANARGQFVSQMPAREGLKEKFDSYLEELGLS